MDEPPAPAPARLPHWLPVVLIVLFGAGLRLWMIAHAEVAARDSIGFISYALKLERGPWLEVVRKAEQPPGYALAVLVVSRPVRWWAGGLTCEAMVLSTQLASLVAGVLLVVPMYRLGKELYDRRTGLLAAGLFQTLPVWTKVTSDGLSEATFLFWAAWSLLFGVQAFRQPSWGRCFLCGLTAGCAYLTRPEGAEIALVVGAVLLGLQLLPTARRPWRQALPQLAALGCGLLLLLGPYAGMIGRLTNKNTGGAVMFDPSVEQFRFLDAPPPPTAVPPLGVWWGRGRDDTTALMVWGLRSVVTETCRGLNWVGAGLALFGACWVGVRPKNRYGLLMLTVLCGLHALVLWRVAVVGGYLSERHASMLVLAGCFPAAVALGLLARRCAALPLPGGPRGVAFWATALLIVLATPELATAGKGLHTNRAGHRAAGQWLAVNAEPEAPICDPFCWAHFYAGRVFHDEANPVGPPWWYVVLETSDNQHSRLPLIPEAKAKASIGSLVYHWPEDRPVQQAQVVVYKVPWAVAGRE
jgi:Dolichyl-phosphate-mannose-protein mannosyltransferase